MKVFGFSMNISETYDVRHSLEEIKYLVELERYKMKTRKNDSDLVKWENQQLKIMKKNQWTGQKFVVLVFYGEFTDSTDLHVSNYTARFDEGAFTAVSARLEQKHFPAELYPEHS